MNTPEPPALRAAARRLLTAAVEVERDAAHVRGTSLRTSGVWTGAAAVVHAGACGDHHRQLLDVASALHDVARRTGDYADRLDPEWAELRGLLDRRGRTPPGPQTARLEGDIAAVRARLVAHRRRYDLDVAAVRPPWGPRGRMRTGPVSPGPVADPPHRMRKGPVWPIGGPRWRLTPFGISDPQRLSGDTGSVPLCR